MMDNPDVSNLLEMINEKIAAEEPSQEAPNFSTVSEADRIVSRLMYKPNGGPAIREIVMQLCHPGCSISGSADDYHNIIQDLFRIRDFESAKRVSARGLSLFPYNIDLLANAIRATANCADFDSCSDYEKTARSIGIEYWNWRLFVFLIDAYKIRLDVCAPEERESTLAIAHDIADNYLTRFPSDDRAHNAKAELFLLSNDSKNAKAVLSKAIFEQIGEGGNPISAPACCVTYLDLLDPVDKDTCDLIIRIAKKGVHNTAEEQPSASIGYFLYREALARDALISSDTSGNGYANKGAVEDALDCYECAYELLKERSSSYTKTIEERYAILRKRGEGDFSTRSLC